MDVEAAAIAAWERSARSRLEAEGRSPVEVEAIVGMVKAAYRAEVEPSRLTELLGQTELGASIVRDVSPADLSAREAGLLKLTHAGRDLLAARGRP